MGFKEWLGGDKPVTQKELSYIIILYTLAFLVVNLTGDYLERKQLREIGRLDREQIKLDREQAEKLHQNELRRYKEIAKINKRIREDQHKFNMRITKEINTLKNKCKVSKK